MFKLIKKKSKPVTTRQPVQTLPPRSRAFSYHANRTPQEERANKRRVDTLKPVKSNGIAWWKQLPMYIAGIVIIVCVVDSLLLNTNPRVVLLGTTTNQLFLRPPGDYAQAAHELLSHSILNRNKLTINASGVSKSLEEQFPELSDASVALPLIGHRPVVYVAPESPVLILAPQSGGAFIVSDSGKALIATTDVANQASLKLPVVTDQSGLAIQIGKATLPTSSVNFIQTVTQQLQSQNVSTSSLVLPAGGSEFDVHITGQPYFVKFNLQTDPKLQIGTFISVKNYVAAHHVTPSQYIDVRVDGRAYYK